MSEKKKLSEKIKEKENQLRKKQEELKKEMEKVSTVALCLFYSKSSSI